MSKRSVIPFLNQQVAAEHGAIFVKRRFYKEFAIRDGQLMTGQNPFFVRAVAKLLSAELNDKWRQV